MPPSTNGPADPSRSRSFMPPPRTIGREGRFRGEARLAASVNHSHICQLYEIGETDGQLLVKPSFKGRSSATTGRGRNTSPPAERLVRTGVTPSA
jgi:serine/threonine protein kinase